MRRHLVAAAILAALGFGLTVPVALAHNDPDLHTLAWGASPGPTTANDGAQVFSNDEVVAAAVDFDDGVRSWDVVIRPVNGGQPSTCHENLAQEDGKYPTRVYINCPWDTTRATNHTLPGSTRGVDASKSTFSRTWQSQDLGPSVNGKYTIEITAYNGGQAFSCGLLTGCQTLPVEPHPLFQSGSDPPRWREVWVTNAVIDPAGVTNSFDASTNRLRVNWAPNPEPDVSYIVQEKVNDGKWSSGAAVPGNATTYERAIEQPGRYQYRVAAVRPAPTSGSGDGASATKKSEYIATSAVDIAQVTPPTTAGGGNGADGAPDGGDPGVFLPTDPTSSTTAPAGAGPRASAPSKQSAGRAPGRSTGSRPSGSVSRPAGSGDQLGDAEGEGMEDDGYSATLPYDQREQDGELIDELEGEDEEALMIPGTPVPDPRDTRALVVPLAAGLALFVFAMQCTVVLRRRPAMSTAEDDFGDWMGY
jgi:hypothetical protein